ncbi:hypothetical protein BAY1663_02699 [Pseudomonas sp. BAY1663]|nr:hypothetical protein BAY1663_02699 [Pseudomonas sp. BAY1663]
MHRHTRFWLLFLLLGLLPGLVETAQGQPLTPLESLQIHANRATSSLLLYRGEGFRRPICCAWKTTSSHWTPHCRAFPLRPRHCAKAIGNCRSGCAKAPASAAQKTTCPGAGRCR